MAAYKLDMMRKRMQKRGMKDETPRIKRFVALMGLRRLLQNLIDKVKEKLGLFVFNRSNAPFGLLEMELENAVTGSGSVRFSSFQREP